MLEALAGTGTVYSSGTLGSGRVPGTHPCGGVPGTSDWKRAEKPQQISGHPHPCDRGAWGSADHGRFQIWVYRCGEGGFRPRGSTGSQQCRFPGCQVIFVRNNLVNGLTTAAGIWAAAGKWGPGPGSRHVCGGNQRCPAGPDHSVW